MLNTKYTPVLRWKKGEQNALKNLDIYVKDHIIPFLEVPFTPTAQKNLRESLENNWADREFFFYLHPDWYEDEETDTFKVFEKELLKLDSKYAIPVFDLSNTTDILKAKKLPNEIIAIRMQGLEFEQIDSLNEMVDSADIVPNKTILIMDLCYVHDDILFAKKAVLKSSFVDIDNISKFYSVVVSSCSFPKTLNNLEVGKIYTFPRNELEIHMLAEKLAEKFSINYAYSDHGPIALEEVDFVVGMIPNFKIKYSTFDEYLYIKGLSIKKGGLDIGNVSPLCKVLVESNDYSGADFSWGDKKIFEIANGKATSGNLTSWVGYSFNHHITLVIDQL